MAVEILETTTVAYQDVMKRVHDRQPVMLKAATTFTTGDLVTTGATQSGGFYVADKVAATGAVGERCYVYLGETKLIGATPEAGVVYTGEFNIDKINFTGANTAINIQGVLKANDIILEKWGTA
jgi:uncharacterized protein YunC (DUF1805 family)